MVGKRAAFHRVCAPTHRQAAGVVLPILNHNLTQQHIYLIHSFLVALLKLRLRDEGKPFFRIKSYALKRILNHFGFILYSLIGSSWPGQDALGIDIMLCFFFVF